MKQTLVVAFAIILGVTSTVSGQQNSQGETQIRITAGSTIVYGYLNNTRTAQDFIATLPRTLPMIRLHDAEYYTVLPAPLSLEGIHQRTYESGDIAFWTSGDFFGVIFRERPPLRNPIIVIGRVTSDLTIFNNLGRNVDMRFEIAR
jgi:hypothetical protein